MRWALALVALFTLAAAPPRNIAPEQFSELEPGTYRSLSTTVSVARTKGGDAGASYRVEVILPGHKPYRLTLDDHGFESVPPTFAIGRLDKGGPPTLWIETFTGGAHCCRHPRLVMPTAAGVRVVDLETWDGENSGLWPDDEDGDGRRDLIFADNRFLYTFAPYAASYAPPLIYNVIDGKFTDVSTRPGFRKVYISWMKNAWEDCLAGGRGGCAAYVASAARIGKEREAWAEMLRHYDRTTDYDLPPKGCRGKPAYVQDCPTGDEIQYSSYPDALRTLLTEYGYLSD